MEQEEIACRAGLVIPAFFSDKPSDDMVRHLLWMTLGDSPLYIAPRNTWVVVDGDARTARLVEEINARLEGVYGQRVNTCVLPANRGKLWAVKQGIEALLAQSPAVDYIITRDSDGDHIASDMPQLVRAADWLARLRGDTRVLVLGARRSRHHPMGWLRGELETLLDQITLDALAFHLAQAGRALDTSHLLGDQTPDLSSGYKVYGRQAALGLFATHHPQLASLSEEAYWHYGPETVPVVESVLAGVALAEVRRPTWDGQPTSSFGEFRLVSLYGDLLAWVFARLHTPLDVAAQLYDNRAPGRLLRTMAEGSEMLAALRRYSLDKLRTFRQESSPITPPQPPIPFL
jgi:hypothetical protein